MLLKSSILVVLAAFSAITSAVSMAVERSSDTDAANLRWVIVGCKPVPPWCSHPDKAHRCGCDPRGNYRCKTPAFTALCRRSGCRCRRVPHLTEEDEDEYDVDEVEEDEDESVLGGLLEVIAKVHLI